VRFILIRIGKATGQTKKLRLTAPCLKNAPAFCYFSVGKATGQTKKLRVSLDSVNNSPVVLSPSGRSPTQVAAGSLLQNSSPESAEPIVNAKTLLNLTDMLFELFPDYDFR
jgi:hypothetical protein